MGHAFIAPNDPRLPPAATAAHGFATPIAALVIVAVIAVLGWWFFTREAPRVAENL
jgi:hypothetical protein